MFYILYETKEGKQEWELVSGEDAMQMRVGELMAELSCDSDDILVFDSDDAM